MTTKILALTDASGNLVRFVLLPGDTAFDSNAIIADLDKRGTKVVISQHPRRTKPRNVDTEIYRWCHLIENFFCKTREFKRIAMRSEKTDLTAAAINSR